MKRNVKSQNNLNANVNVSVHDIETVKQNIQNWEGLSKKEKLEKTKEIQPDKEIHVKNTTVDGLNEYLVDNLDTGQSVNKDASHIEIGSDSSGGTNTGDTSMNSLINTFAVTNTNDNGKDLFTSTFIDSTQANGNDLEECGLTTSSSGGTLLNHATFQTITKDSSKTVTIDVTLKFRSA